MAPVVSKDCDGDALDDVDAEFGGAAAQRAVEHLVLDHVGEGFAGADFAVEGEKDRPHRIGGLRIGDDHVGDRLGLGRDLFPAAEALEHAAGGGGDGRGAAVLAPDLRRGGVDDGDVQAGARLLDRDGGGEADIAGTGDEHVELRRFLFVGLVRGHGSILSDLAARLDLTGRPDGNRVYFRPAKGESMPAAIQELLSILDLEELEHNLYRGRSPQVDWQRVFGGQTIAQALVAAQRTVEPDRHVHSLHGYFMRPGDITVPIVYEVDRIRDGVSFTTRRVVAIQHGQAIFSLEASFQVDEPGLEHQMPMPLDVPRARGAEIAARTARNGEPCPRRDPAASGPRSGRSSCARSMLEHYSSRDKLPPLQKVWIRADRPGTE